MLVIIICADGQQLGRERGGEGEGDMMCYSFNIEPRL